MSGIVFLGTKKMQAIRDFYVARVGMSVWLEQADCIILKHGNLLLGFCERENADTDGVFTFFYDNKDGVDAMYDELRDFATTGLEEVEKYRIYRFFALDPEGRKVEFQYFLDHVGTYRDGEDLLLTRRSIRKFEDRQVPDEVLWKVFETCRYSPTSKNVQSYYFIPIRKKKTLDFLASTRGPSTAPIGRAPMAMAIVSDPDVSPRHVQDGCIAAYHFILACWAHGLGTCWMAAMDRDDVKEATGVPKDHFIATLIPVGYPYKIPRAPSRKKAKEYVNPFVE